MDFDLVIVNGTVVDGTGHPGFRADVGISRGRITAVAQGERLVGPRTVDATGFVVAPGFIDIHSHSDWVVPLRNHDTTLAPFVLQGVTTIVAGNCGTSPSPVSEASLPLVLPGGQTMMGPRPEDLQSSPDAFFAWRSTGEYLDFLERNGILLNVAALVGHGTLRYAAVGRDPAAPGPQALDEMKGLLRRSLREGAYGMSVGLAFTPGVFAEDEEITALLRVVAEEQGIWTVHGHTYSWNSPFFRPNILGMPHNRRDVRRLLGMAKQTGARVQLSHVLFKGRRTWRTYKAVLRDIEQAVEGGLDAGFDVIPYHWGNTLVNVLFPAWFLAGFERNIYDPQAMARLKREVAQTEWLMGRRFSDLWLLWGGEPELEPFVGLDFAEIARRLSMKGIDAYLHVAKVSKGRARIRTATYSGEENVYEEPLRALLSHPLCSFELDTMLSDEGAPNPASYGGFPRVLGRYSRDLGLFPIEDAVRRLTGYSAQRIGLKEVGEVRAGYWADLTLFDPATVADNTSLTHLDAPPTGIKTVLISGEVVARDGQMLQAGRPGRVIRRN